MRIRSSSLQSAGMGGSDAHPSFFAHLSHLGPSGGTSRPAGETVSPFISCWTCAPICFAGVGHHSCCHRGGQSPGTFEKRLMKFIPEPRPLLLQRGTRSRALRASSWPPRPGTFSAVKRRLGSYVLGIFPETRIPDSILL